jgi:hypothetical protein
LQGDLIAVRPDEGGLRLAVEARVNGLRSGSAREPRNMMPTWLDWLRENRAATLYWGALVAGFGLLAALRNWWRQ